MFMKRKKFDAILANIDNMEKSMGIMAQQGIEQQYQISQRMATSYTTRDAQVAATRRKFRGADIHGNQIIQRIVNLRVAFSVPNRLFLIKNKDKDVSDSVLKDTKEFLKNFMKLNKLDSSLPRDLAKEVELQGSVLLVIEWDEKAKLPKIKYFPWKSLHPKIEQVDKYSIASPLKASFKVAGVEKKFEDDKLEFIAFNDELGDFEGYPTCGGILKTIENIDKDLIDWRKLNHLFAHPTPHFKCETKEEADAINNMISTVGWHVGTAIATNSEFSLKGTSGVEANLLMLSIQTGAKIISGHTGIGIHFLGFANVMSNRATADSMGEPTEVVLHAEITSWTSFYTSLFAKAIRMRNNELNKALPEDLVLPKIIPLTDRQWKVVKEIYMPLAEKGHITRETLLENLPEIDSDAELKRLEEEEAKIAEELKKNPPPVADDNRLNDNNDNNNE